MLLRTATIFTLLCTLTVPAAGFAQDTTTVKRDGVKIHFTGPTGLEGKDNAAVVLGAAGNFKTFLKLAERAKLTPLLTGAVVDSTKTEVTTTAPNTSGMTLNAEGAEQFRSMIRKTVSNAMGTAMNEMHARSGVMTIFAPTDEAFAKLPKKMLNAILADSAKAAAVVREHIVNRGIYARSFTVVERVQTLAGRTLPFTPKAVGDAEFVHKDLVSGNALIHGVDKVLLPPPAAGAPKR